jgi:hypothetical protein
MQVHASAVFSTVVRRGYSPYHLAMKADNDHKAHVKAHVKAEYYD